MRLPTNPVSYAHAVQRALIIQDGLDDGFEPILTTWGNWENEILGFFDVLAMSGKALINAYTECQNGLTRAIDRMGRGYSFDTIRVKLLLAPKKQGIITSYRSIRRKKEAPPMMEYAMFQRTTSIEKAQYEVVKVQERQPVVWGVDIAQLAGWLEEDITGQKRLPGVA